MHQLHLIAAAVGVVTLSALGVLAGRFRMAGPDLCPQGH
jgi:hypothetical protein